MAPLTRSRKRALVLAPAAARVIDPADRISRLPEEIQAHILSFLPAQEAVRMCVLSRTWRDVWKFTRRLLITGKSVMKVRQFMDRLLRVRLDGLKVASLDASEIRFNPCEEFDDIDDSEKGPFDDPSLEHKDASSINRWICRVLECQIEMLRIDIDAQTYLDAYLQMSHMPLLVSQHLTRLELRGVWFVRRCLNLDGCPALEHLKINESCFEGVREMTSRSLKHLIITSCESNYACSRIQISVPRLVSLFLKNDGELRTPLLERMPELVEATIWIDSSHDWCHCDDLMGCYHVTRAADTSDNDSDSNDSDSEEASGVYAAPGQNTTKCVVLEGVAQATNLVLVADQPTYIFRRDLRWCPIFSKLKTLVLDHDNWCHPADCSALACILEHAPLLEKLTLNPSCWLQSSKYEVEMKGQRVATMKPTKISQHLKIVEINCCDVNERFLNVLNFLGTLNICFEIRVSKKVLMKKQPFH